MRPEANTWESLCPVAQIHVGTPEPLFSSRVSKRAQIHDLVTHWSGHSVERKKSQDYAPDPRAVCQSDKLQSPGNQSRYILQSCRYNTDTGLMLSVQLPHPHRPKQGNHCSPHFLPAHLQAGNFHRLHNVFPRASPSGQSLISSLLNIKLGHVRWTTSCKLERNLWRKNTWTSSKQVMDVIIAQPVFIILALEFSKSQFVIIPFSAEI